jgi:hypothetical protein
MLSADSRVQRSRLRTSALSSCAATLLTLDIVERLVAPPRNLRYMVLVEEAMESKLRVEGR